MEKKERGVNNKCCFTGCLQQGYVHFIKVIIILLGCTKYMKIGDQKLVLFHIVTVLDVGL